jgi:DNA-binding transcriptional ArsR family regulator
MSYLKQYPNSENQQADTSSVSSSEKTLPMDLVGLKKAVLILRAYNHSLRQQILKLIHSNDRMTVTEIYIQLRLEQSVASQHLAILRKAGYVNTDRDGKFIYYSVNNARLEEVNSIIKELVS